jgi:hypothetical protein
MARLEVHVARIGQSSSMLSIGRPAFEQDGAHRCALHRTAHPLPGDRRPGVQQAMLRTAQKRDHPAGRQHVDQHRSRAEQPLHGRGIADSDPGPERIVRIVLQPSQQQA